jgi:hypothetical protein
MKNYNEITRNYLQSAGLKQVRLKDAATGATFLRNITQAQEKQFKKIGRIVQ